MGFDWIYYLRIIPALTNEIFGSEDQEPLPPLQEARLRAANHAAYYSAFHFAKTYVAAAGKTIPRHNVHQFVIDFFMGSPQPDRKNIGYDLRRLRDLRNQADYDDEVDDLIDKTQEAIRLAHKLVRKFL